ncbi:hypothetical protein GCM10011499_16930 [Pelagibacterium lentulum]|uniref:Uncharacterized protein n=1 Tax=Pelagibacterium lentulum TaxID=2029865 RepID=A0A916VX84_9HYPH|nr:hypothetical protein GCM10011499_16930 [Pelagibacterium lentulum]
MGKLRGLGEVGRSGENVRRALCRLLVRPVKASSSEGQDGVEELLAVAGLLDVGDLTATAVSNPGFRDLG